MWSSISCSPPLGPATVWVAAGLPLASSRLTVTSLRLMSLPAAPASGAAIASTAISTAKPRAARAMADRRCFVAGQEARYRQGCAPTPWMQGL